MKRSEAVKVVIKELEHHVPDHVDLKLLGSGIIYELERIGMLPPHVELKKTGKGCLCTMREGCEECDTLNKYYDNMWESEDDTED